MKQLNLSGKEVRLVPVPRDAFDFAFKWSTLYKYWVLTYKSPVIWEMYKRVNWMWDVHFVNEPPIVIGKGDEVTEEQAREIVTYEHVPDLRISGYEDYGCGFGEAGSEYHLPTALESLYSLLKREGLDKETTLILTAK